MKMKAAVCREPNVPVTIEEVELDPPKDRELLVKTMFTGFCHSDYSLIKGFSPFIIPTVVGHEAAGVVVGVGPGVTSVQEGDHVVTTWQVSCGKCKLCVSGRTNLCRTYMNNFIAGTLTDGTSRLKDSRGQVLWHQAYVSGFAEYMVVPEEAAIKVSKDLPLDQACLLGCCVPTGFGAVYNTAQVKPGDSVAVWGVGGVGLNVLQGAKLQSANPVIAVDLEGGKEAMAREFGATHFIDASKEDPVPRVQELTDGGADFIFEVTGDPGAIRQVYWAMGAGGKQVQIGVAPVQEAVSLPIAFTPAQQRDIIGSLYGGVNAPRYVPILADMVLTGKYIDLNRLITKKFRIEEINDVCEAMARREILGRWVCRFD
jgi:S-(hydroxymethyl)glutathione dehydrogenase/alcohol dehydrogenase